MTDNDATGRGGADAAESALMGEVDQDPRAHRPTETDEEQVLAALYGPPDEDGFYRAPGAEPGTEPGTEPDESGELGEGAGAES